MDAAVFRRSRWRQVWLAGVVWLVTAMDLSGEERLLFDGFTANWKQRWKEQGLFSKPTMYVVVQDGGQPVLQATSRAANSCLLRQIDIASPRAAKLSWRWKVQAPLTGNTAERERRGDDYAARVLVVFEHSVVPLLTRAINFVWAAHERVGTVFPSPYSANVGMVVLRSGDSSANRWMTEGRDVIADYQQFFGKPPSKISAVAVLVDTDNTGRSAEAWFADLLLQIDAKNAPRE